ncbi:MAG: RnfABCDGE type electron transport complex subunit D [Gammaproteobacteria bacterium]|nr:RnfABCDGE type electron transport complex subunit D [Gammaproteobacteria bacterium]
MRNFSTAPAPHILGADPVSRVMRDVLLGLVPVVIVYVIFFGVGVIVNILIAAIVCVGCEAAIMKMRNRDVQLYVGDLSALVCASLLALALPPVTPWYVTVTGSLFAIVVAKHLYGGLGFNTFNPAMVGYVVLLIAFPVPMADLWLSPVGDGPGIGATLAAIFTGSPPVAGWDAVTMATPLDRVQGDLARGMMMTEVMADPVMDSAVVSAWTWINIAALAGGIYLMFRGVVRWHIPVSVLLGLAVMATLFNISNPDQYPSAWFHLTNGSAVLGAFFIATDPVSAATSRRGRLIYGAGIGVLIYVIRTWGAYPDGVAFAVLLLNMAVPAIDYFTIPRAYGEQRERK